MTTTFLTQLKQRLIEIWNELWLEPLEPKAPTHRQVAASDIYEAQHSPVGWCVLRRESAKIVFGPWDGAGAEAKARNLARCLNENRRIRAAQGKAVA